jgi:hypothetical protein
MIENIICTIIGGIILLIFIMLLHIEYIRFQLIRLYVIREFSLKWIEEKQLERLQKHPINVIFEPCLKNWYGLKYPKESDYE